MCKSRATICLKFSIYYFCLSMEISTENNNVLFLRYTRCATFMLWYAYFCYFSRIFKDIQFRLDDFFFSLDCKRLNYETFYRNKERRDLLLGQSGFQFICYNSRNDTRKAFLTKKKNYL